MADFTLRLCPSLARKIFKPVAIGALLSAVLSGCGGGAAKTGAPSSNAPSIPRTGTTTTSTPAAGSANNEALAAMACRLSESDVQAAIGITVTKKAQGPSCMYTQSEGGFVSITAAKGQGIEATMGMLKNTYKDWKSVDGLKNALLLENLGGQVILARGDHFFIIVAAGPDENNKSWTIPIAKKFASTF